jgi:hypothetical protein
VLWPEVEVENSGSGRAHEMQIEIKAVPETPPQRISSSFDRPF